VGGTPQIVEKVVKETVVVKQATAAPKQAVTVRNIIWSPSSKNIPLYESYSQTFSAKRPDIKIEFIFVPEAQYVARLKTMEAAGDPPEVCMPIGGAINQWRGPNFDKWLDIQPLVDRDNYDLTDFHDTSIFSAKNPFNGQMDGLGVQLFAGFLVYNKDLFAKAGVPEPTHKWATDAWDHAALIELAKKLTLDETGKTPNDPGFDKTKVAQFGYWDSSFDQYWGWAFGGEGGASHPTDRYNIYVGEKPYIEGAQYWQDFSYASHVNPNPAEQGQFTGTLSSPFHTGKVAMAFGMTWNVASYIGIKNFKYDFAAMPHGPKRDRYINRLCMDQGAMFAAGKFTDQSWEWIKFCASPEMSGPFSVDLRECLPARKSAIPKYGERLALQIPEVDGNVVAESLAYAWYFEYWNPPNGWSADIWVAFRDKVRFGDAPAAEVFPEAQVKLQKSWDDYYAAFPSVKKPARLTF
jgi:multiple sugar transport system substrate-binding protein